MNAIIRHSDTFFCTQIIDSQDMWITKQAGRMGHACFTPIRYLLGGKTLTIISRNENQLFTAQVHQAPARRGLNARSLAAVIAAIVLLTPGIILKILSYASERVRSAHRQCASNTLIIPPRRPPANPDEKPKIRPANYRITTFPSLEVSRRVDACEQAAQALINIDDGQNIKSVTLRRITTQAHKSCENRPPLKFALRETLITRADNLLKDISKAAIQYPFALKITQGDRSICLIAQKADDFRLFNPLCEGGNSIYMEQFSRLEDAIGSIQRDIFTTKQGNPPRLNLECLMPLKETPPTGTGSIPMEEDSASDFENTEEDTSISSPDRSKDKREQAFDANAVYGKQNQYSVGPESACSCHAIHAGCKLLDTNLSQLSENTIDDILAAGADTFRSLNTGNDRHLNPEDIEEQKKIPQGYHLLPRSELSHLFPVKEEWMGIFKSFDVEVETSSIIGFVEKINNKKPIALLFIYSGKVSTLVLNSSDELLFFDSHGKDSGSKSRCAYVQRYESADAFASAYVDSAGDMLLYQSTANVYLLEKKQQPTLLTSHLTAETADDLLRHVRGHQPRSPIMQTDLFLPCHRIPVTKNSCIYLANNTIRETLLTNPENPVEAINQTLSEAAELIVQCGGERPNYENLIRLPSVFISVNGCAPNDRAISRWVQELSIPDMSYLQFPIAENEEAYREALNSPDLADIFASMDQAINEGQDILIHCNQGEHRSAACLTLYLASRSGLSFEEAWNCVQRQRSPIKPYTEEVRGRQNLMTTARQYYEKNK